MSKKKEIMIPTNLAETLRFYREQMSYSQQQIADSLQIDRSTYTCYELGRTVPSNENINKLARIFGVPTDTLLTFTYNMPSPSSSTIVKVNDSGLDDYYKKLLGSNSVGDLSPRERDLIISFRSLTDAQQLDWLEAIKASQNAPDKKDNN